MRAALRQGVSVLKWSWRDVKPFLPILSFLLSLDLFAGLQGVLTAVLSKRMVDGAMNGNMNTVVWTGGFLAFLVLVGMGVSFVSRIKSATLLERFAGGLRQRLYTHLIRAQWQEGAGRHSGDWVTRLSEDVSDLTGVLLGTLPGLLTLGVQLLISFLVLFHFEPLLAVLAFVLAPLSLLASRIWGRRMKQLQQQTQQADSQLFAFLQESIRNIPLLKVFQRESHLDGQLGRLHRKRVNLAGDRERMGAVTGAVLGLGYWAGYLLSFAWGAVQLARKATTFGTMTAFIQLVQQVQAPFLGLARSLPSLIRGVAAAERLMEMDALTLETGMGGFTSDADVRILSVDAGGRSVSLRVKQLRYAYATGKSGMLPEENPVLDRLDLEVSPGEVVAVAGRSGCGKTTLVRLLEALVHPDEGEIIWRMEDGTELHAGDISIRQHLSVVPQGNSLMSGTLRENLLVGNPEADDATLYQAMEQACARDICSTSNEGLDMLVGEGGFGLSEGQAQRVGLARALLRNAPFLILDEVTSALDQETEIQVLDSIRRWSVADKKKRSVLFISHQQAILHGCDHVYWMENGKLFPKAENST